MVAKVTPVGQIAQVAIFAKVRLLGIALFLVAFMGALNVVLAEESTAASATGAIANAPRNYDRAVAPTQPTELDTYLAGKTYKVEKIDSTLIPVAQAAVADNDKPDGLFTLQFEAVGEFDAAQKRRAVIERKSGYGTHLVFDSPFYKIRGGSFTKRVDAEDAARRLQDSGVAALVIRLR